MAIIKTVQYTGASSVSTLSGDIRLEQSKGRLVIYDPSNQQELTVVDRTGFLFSDGTDRRIKLGSYATRVGFWMSKPGEDVIDLLAA
jgi:hypothetical protein